jgi:hypothetical protein
MNFLAFCYALAQNIELAISNLTSPPVFGCCTYNQLKTGVRPRCLNINKLSNQKQFLIFLYSSYFVCCVLPFFTFILLKIITRQFKIYGSILKRFHLSSLGIGLVIQISNNANKYINDRPQNGLWAGRSLSSGPLYKR